MQAGEFVASDSQFLVSRVLVAGVQREHASWSVDREIVGDMPAQVVAGSGVRQATGSIEFVGRDVQTLATNPFNRSTGWTPRPGDSVEIWAGDGTNEYRQFTGRIDKPSGAVGSGFSATIIDDYDDTSATVSHDPMLRQMPPIELGGPVRMLALSPMYYVDLAFRASGFHCTPPPEVTPALVAHGQGSVWPFRGTVSSTIPVGDRSDAQINAAPWGIALSQFDVTYLPANQQPATAPVQLTVCIAPDHAGNFFMTCTYGGDASKTVELSVTGGRVVIARVAGVEVCRLTLGESTIVTLLFKAGTATLRTNLGVEASGYKGLSAGTMSSIRVAAYEGARAAGFQVSHPDTVGREFVSTRFVPSAFLDASSTSLAAAIDAAPAIMPRTAGSLIDELSSCTLSGAWIDELGRFQWVPANVLRSRSVVATLTTLDDVLSLDWEDSTLGHRAKVTVTGKTPHISLSKWRNIIVHEGGIDELRSEETSEEFIEPASDEDWILPDATITRIGSGNWWPYNARTYTVAGGYFSANGDTVSSSGLSVVITLEKTGITQFVLKQTAGVFPSDVVFNPKTSPIDAELYTKNRDKPLPRIPAGGKIQWGDVSSTPITAGGAGPELVHDSGYWANRSSGGLLAINRIADFLSAQTAVPQPVITGLEVVFDPRRQLGDVVSIQSPQLMGVKMRALIVGVNTDASESGISQTLAVRIISVETTFTTYEAYFNSLAGANLTYAQWEALGPSPQTYTQFDAS